MRIVAGVVDATENDDQTQPDNPAAVSRHRRRRAADPDRLPATRIPRAYANRCAGVNGNGNCNARRYRRCARPGGCGHRTRCRRPGYAGSPICYPDYGRPGNTASGAGRRYGVAAANCRYAANDPPIRRRYPGTANRCGNCDCHRCAANCSAVRYGYYAAPNCYAGAGCNRCAAPAIRAARHRRRRNPARLCDAAG